MSNSGQTVQSLLESLGFSPADGEVYWALLHVDTVSIRKVAAAAGLNRGLVYESLKRLAAAGLVGVRRSGSREHYTAESPEKIQDIIRDRRKELWAVQQRAEVLVPYLLAHKTVPAATLVRYFEDDAGIVAILRDVLQTCGRLPSPEYVIYSSRAVRGYLYRQFPEFTERRVAEGIRVRAIAIGEGGDPAAASQRKWLDEPEGSVLASYVIIYGDKVATISLTNQFVPYGVVLEDAGTAAMQRLLFNQLWHTL